MVVTSRAPVRIDLAGAWTDVDIFAKGAGGAVVNATIDKYVVGTLRSAEGGDGISVEYRCELPAGSGLGTSAALNVCWLSLVAAGDPEDETYRVRIAELAYDLEAMLGILGGKQDQYASALGGFNYLRFAERVTAEQLHLDPAFVSELEQSLVLCYTGKSRLSSRIHENVWGAFRRGAETTISALYRLRETANRMRTALMDADMAAFVSLVSESWACQKALDASVTNSDIERMFAAAGGAGATGGKACGAGGGGCLLFCCTPESHSTVADAMAHAGALVIPFKFESQGLHVTRAE